MNQILLPAVLTAALEVGTIIRFTGEEAEAQTRPRPCPKDAWIRGAGPGSEPGVVCLSPEAHELSRWTKDAPETVRPSLPLADPRAGPAALEEGACSLGRPAAVQGAAWSPTEAEVSVTNPSLSWAAGPGFVKLLWDARKWAAVQNRNIIIFIIVLI